eukprot:5091475-Prymnesium_polylepis.1
MYSSGLNFQLLGCKWWAASLTFIRQPRLVNVFEDHRTDNQVEPLFRGGQLPAACGVSTNDFCIGFDHSTATAAIYPPGVPFCCRL